MAHWHPNCEHAEHRGRMAPIVCDYHRCAVRGVDVYNQGDCDGCPSRQPLKRPKGQGEIMPGRPSFWDGVDEDTKEPRLEIARRLQAEGVSVQQIEKQLSGPKNTLAGKLKPKPAAAPTAGAPRPVRERPAAQSKARPQAAEDSETATPLFDAASEEELRDFILYRKLEKGAENFLGVAAYLRGK